MILQRIEDKNLQAEDVERPQAIETSKEVPKGSNLNKKGLAR